MTYTHPIFGSGYTIESVSQDGWCTLRKAFPDGSYSSCGEMLESLVVDEDNISKDSTININKEVK